MRVIVTRPEDDAASLRGDLERLGHDVIVQPLLLIVRRAGVAIPQLPYQAVLATSANGIRCLPTLGSLRDLPMLTVGQQSLAAAKAAGFTNAEAHGGDVHGLADHVHAVLRPENGPLLYLAGAEVAGDLQAQLTAVGFHCVKVVLYDAVPAQSLGAAGWALKDGRADAVLLYSPRTARIWLSLVKAQGVEDQAASLFTLCLSRNVAVQLPGSWRIHVAEKPDNAAMLGLLEHLAGTV
ncbi:MAG: uroporphyrinogen-III synthase [Alphaproteobacteria bacterium]|nr:uroporphyrinogen-III synthase [Alphaproteobacteria bacterium]